MSGVGQRTIIKFADACCSETHSDEYRREEDDVEKRYGLHSRTIPFAGKRNHSAFLDNRSAKSILILGYETEGLAPCLG